jgi:hypothetical protein
MSRAGHGELRPLPFLHVVIMLGLGVGWASYCWSERSILLEGLHPRSADRDRGLDHAFAVLSMSSVDVLLGACTLVLLAVGTGVYVRRFQTWIDARSSGEAVAYRSADLKDQALAANANTGPKR